MGKFMVGVALAVIIGILRFGTAESLTLDQEALAFAREKIFKLVLVECGALSYPPRIFTGDTNRHVSEWAKTNQWYMYEFKNVTYKVTAKYIAEFNYIDQQGSDYTKILLSKDPTAEWIGRVQLEEESARKYSATPPATWEDIPQTFQGEPVKVAPYYLDAWVKKRAAEWHIIEYFGQFSRKMPKLSCQEIAKLRK